MIRINLIREKRKKRRELSAGSAWIALPLVSWPGRSTSTPRSREDLQARRGHREGNADIARLKKEIGEVEKFKVRKAELQKKVDVISNLQKGRRGPSRYFEALSAAIPEKCWIDTLGLKDEKVTLSGIA